MMRPAVIVTIGLSAALWMGCRDKSPAIAEKMTAINLVAGTDADSVRATDPWLKYDYEQRLGKRMFNLYCAVCHGALGEGDGFNAYNLDPRPHSFADSTYMAALSDATLTEIISRGGRGMNKSVLMPAYKATLSADQIKSLVRYIRTLLPAASSQP